ncbi:MAG: pseudoazurin [Gammaproteobacteria bacterium]|nr:pseudoazurin [Gammaproteobacteria bacterium]
MSAQSVVDNIRPVGKVCVVGQACVGAIRGDSLEQIATAPVDQVAASRQVDSVQAAPASKNISSGEQHEIRMLNQGSDGVMVFEPSVLRVQVGDSVTFKAEDPGHNAASIEGMIPDGANPWDSGMSQDLTVTFSEEGTYVYQCTPHLMMSMVGVIAVGNANSNLVAIKDAAAEKKSAFLMEQDRLDRYLEGI